MECLASDVTQVAACGGLFQKKGAAVFIKVLAVVRVAIMMIAALQYSHVFMVGVVLLVLVLVLVVVVVPVVVVVVCKIRPTTSNSST